MNVLEKILEEIETEKGKQCEVCKDMVNTPGYRLYEKNSIYDRGNHPFPHVRKGKSIKCRNNLTEY